MEKDYMRARKEWAKKRDKMIKYENENENEKNNPVEKIEKSQMKSKNKITPFLLFFFLFWSNINSQNLKILNDSILVDNSYFKLQEIKINSDNKKAISKIYHTIQSSYDIFDGLYFDTPEERIKAKKDTVSNRILKNTLRDTNTGFEHYEIYFDKKGIINLSIGIQYYGSPWEEIKYYCFDLDNGDRIGLNLFTNQKMLLKKIKYKIKDQDINLLIKQNNLLNFKIIIDKNKNISGIDFLIFETKNYRNSGYEEYIIHFSWKEMEKFILPLYKNRFFKK